MNQRLTSGHPANMTLPSHAVTNPLNRDHPQFGNRRTADATMRKVPPTRKYDAINKVSTAAPDSGARSSMIPAITERTAAPRDRKKPLHRAARNDMNPNMTPVIRRIQPNAMTD